MESEQRFIQPSKAEEIRPFRIDVAYEALFDFRQHLAATRWADKETVIDRFQGVLPP